MQRQMHQQMVQQMLLAQQQQQQFYNVMQQQQQQQQSVTSDGVAMSVPGMFVPSLSGGFAPQLSAPMSFAKQLSPPLFFARQLSPQYPLLSSLGVISMVDALLVIE